MMSTILVAEDSAPVRHGLVSLLTDCGYQVLEASDGQEAYELALSDEDAIDLVITDLKMPRKTGIELFRALRASHFAKPVVLYTAHEYIVSGVPFAAVLCKSSANADQIIETVSRILRQSVN